eukprot:4309306-Pleurochrysis_carterae.AAC.3
MNTASEAAGRRRTFWRGGDGRDGLVSSNRRVRGRRKNRGRAWSRSLPALGARAQPMVGTGIGQVLPQDAGAHGWLRRVW